MKRLLLVLLAVWSIASGCGDDPGRPGSSATDTEPTSSGTPAPTRTGNGGPVTPEDIAASGQEPAVNVLTVLSESAVDGEVATEPTYEVDDPGFGDFVSQFTNGRMAAAIEAELASYRPTDGMLLAATVIAIGCDEPTGVEVATADGSIVVEAVIDKAVPGKQCLVPVTSVALYELRPAS